MVKHFTSPWAARSEDPVSQSGRSHDGLPKRPWRGWMACFGRVALPWRSSWLGLMIGVIGVASAGEALPRPTVFPAPGTYSNTTSITLMDGVPGAEIHYTWDG